ncbi:hypothetical protein KR222_010154, partial [Zaprionus bogoriensis]
MRLKEYPEIIVDAIPKLHESHIKVFITHLSGIEKQVNRLPKQFCKMYTTKPLAQQLLHYLSTRNANISQQDFLIVEHAQPFMLRLSDGKRLQVMLCAGNELGSSLMLLIRKWQGGRLLYYYSAVQQDDLCLLIGNATYHEWISHGTDELLLNLQAAHRPFVPIDFEEVAKEVKQHGKFVDNPIVIKLPVLGYEFIARRLAQTCALFGHIKLQGNFLRNYCSLSSDLRCFHQPGFKITAHIMDIEETELRCSERSYPLGKLKWSPVPNRMNLIQICSLLRPNHISGIVGYHDTGNAPPVPDYLKRFKLGYSPKA